MGRPLQQNEATLASVGTAKQVYFLKSGIGPSSVVHVIVGQPGSAFRSLGISSHILEREQCLHAGQQAGPQEQQQQQGPLPGGPFFPRAPFMGGAIQMVCIISCC